MPRYIIYATYVEEAQASTEPLMSIHGWSPGGWTHEGMSAVLYPCMILLFFIVVKSSSTNPTFLLLCCPSHPCQCWANFLGRNLKNQPGTSSTLIPATCKSCDSHMTCMWQSHAKPCGSHMQAMWNSGTPNGVYTYKLLHFDLKIPSLSSFLFLG